MKFYQPILLILFAVLSPLFSQPINTLTPEESDQGWMLLFDGKSFNGWQKNNATNNAVSGWEIKDGILSVQPGVSGGDIITTSSFENFELSLEFAYDKGANSGIKYFIQLGSSIGCEYQILDDKNHPDSKAGHNNNRQLSALYDLVPTVKDKPVKPIGEWNHARIIVKDGLVAHWLNGKKVIQYDRFSQCFRQLVLFSKFKNEKDFGLHISGHILLQDHGDHVSYRNIKIKKL